MKVAVRIAPIGAKCSQADNTQLRNICTKNRSVYRVTTRTGHLASREHFNVVCEPCNDYFENQNLKASGSPRTKAGKWNPPVY